MSRSDNKLPLIFSWPPLKWQREFWLSLIPFILAFVIFFFPQLTDRNLSIQIRRLIGIPLILSPVIVPIGVWIVWVIKAAFARVRKYQFVWTIASNQLREIELLKAELSNVALSLSYKESIGIVSATVHDGDIYLLIKRSEEHSLGIEDRIVVLDISDGMLMGVFRITREQDSMYYATEISGIDPLWKGKIIELGEAKMFPNMIAMPLIQGGPDDETIE